MYLLAKAALPPRGDDSAGEQIPPTEGTYFLSGLRRDLAVVATALSRVGTNLVAYPTEILGCTVFAPRHRCRRGMTGEYIKVWLIDDTGVGAGMGEPLRVVAGAAGPGEGDDRDRKRYVRLEGG